MHGGGGAGEAATRAGEVFGSDVGSFQGLGLSQALSDHLASLKFEAPTRVQQQAIPPLLVGCGGGTFRVQAMALLGKPEARTAALVPLL